MTFKALLKPILSHWMVHSPRIGRSMMSAHVHTQTHTLWLVFYWLKQQDQNKTLLLEIILLEEKEAIFMAINPLVLINRV